MPALKHPIVVAPPFASVQRVFVVPLTVPALKSLLSVPCTLVCAVEPFTVSEVVAFSVVNLPLFGVVIPIVLGISHVKPSSCEAFKFATCVVDATMKGGVPVTTVEVI